MHQSAGTSSQTERSARSEQVSASSLDPLKPEEFDAHLAAHTVRISFVGMANAGKSYRSRILQEEGGFLWYEIDEEIQKALGFVDMAEISAWMGYPMSEGYIGRERTYLELEDKYTREAAMQTHGKNLVFDTTGSVIHLPQSTLDILKHHTLMVHLDVGEDSLAQMVEKFFEEPKPVAWDGYFSMRDGESEDEALRRCFPALLNERLKRYRSLAHINLPASEVHDRSAEETLKIIRSYL
jgi:shikimate kinase